ncbi:MAG: DNA repair protein RadC [Myxococcota bacterium]|jgi:DNA repair protein RadC
MRVLADSANASAIDSPSSSPSETSIDDKIAKHPARDPAQDFASEITADDHVDLLAADFETLREEHDPFVVSHASAHDLPRERLTRLGAEALSDAELVALLLRTGGGGLDAVGVARILLDASRGLLGLPRFLSAGRAAIPGLGPAKTASLNAAIELGRRASGRRLRIGEPMRGPDQIHRHFHPRLRDCEHELFLVVLLDSRHRIMREAIISKGTLTASLVHPREVFRPAIRESAAAIVLIHNHPSGEPAPSSEDREVTRRLASAGKLMGVRVVDHVIVAERGYFSFCEAGELELDPEP